MSLISYHIDLCPATRKCPLAEVWHSIFLAPACLNVVRTGRASAVPNVVRRLRQFVLVGSCRLYGCL